MKVKKVFSVVLVIICAVIIFIFSSQNGADSVSLSKNVNSYISKFYIIKQFLILVPIRKVAHFILYFILYLAVYNMISICFNFRVNNSYYILTLFITFIYACSDEFHQLFVSGRGSCCTDILIDTLGSFVALIFCILFDIILNKCKRKQRNAQVKYNN